MKRNLFFWMAAACVGAACAAGPRDPFWPIGFDPNPPKPKPVEKPVVQAPAPKPAAPKPEPPKKVKEVTAAEWKAAEARIHPNGIFGSSGKFRVMIDGKIYPAGSGYSLTNGDVRFEWTLGVSEKRKLELERKKAERLAR
ncbi:MAG: hypothetical protein J5985_06835 [Kiritimatiellae bacterium]|nr:hypothetical protein [Kiritimatiellia bacterium]